MLVLSLFDYSTYALKPWYEAGHECVAVDELHNDSQVPENLRPSELYAQTRLSWNLESQSTLTRICHYLKPDIVLGFPPCTHLAVSGAKHFAGKAEKNPAFQAEAVALCRVVETIGNHFNVPWMIENPVGKLATMWRKPDWTFHPWEYGGMLQGKEAVHPDWPQFIAKRDCYPKRTGIWCGNGFEMPEAVPARVMPDGQRISFPKWQAQDESRRFSTQFLKLGGSSLKTKIIRSLTPRGFSAAVHAVNDPVFQGCCNE
jgi:hypothetical protein